MSEPQGQWPPVWWPMVISCVGLGLAVYEVVGDRSQRPYLYVLVALLVAGVPAKLIDAVVVWFLGRRNGNA